MHIWPEDKHVLEFHFSTNEFQINAFSVIFGHLPHQEPGEKEPSVYYMNVAYKNSRLALHQTYNTAAYSSRVLHSLLSIFSDSSIFVAGWQKAHWHREWLCCVFLECFSTSFYISTQNDWVLFTNPSISIEILGSFGDNSLLCSCKLSRHDDSKRRGGDTLQCHIWHSFEDNKDHAKL